jgi:hypothetical protein
MGVANVSQKLFLHCFQAVKSFLEVKSLVGQQLYAYIFIKGYDLSWFLIIVSGLFSRKNPSFFVFSTKSLCEL